jgi:inner membrane protein
MKGSTHLAIGTTIGMVATVYYPFTLKNAALYLMVAAFSTLSADLDGPSMLSGKLGKISKLLRELVLWSGVLLVAWVAYLYFTHYLFYPVFTTIAIMVFLLGFLGGTS